MTADGPPTTATSRELRTADHGMSTRYDVAIVGYSWAATAHIGAIAATSKGRVTDVLAEASARTGARRVVACGPMPMLEAVATLCKELSLDCEVAVEEFMACGIGVCWTCVVEINGTGDPQFQRSCTEGRMRRSYRSATSVRLL